MYVLGLAHLSGWYLRMSALRLNPTASPGLPGVPWLVFAQGVQYICQPEGEYNRLNFKYLSKH
jgi:hypothetical protein